ncbi:hypothetical protein I4U23_020687 [Adineta vaga]|nr:hypothetical protein I4U23_020687 [Adineta vaga]
MHTCQNKSSKRTMLVNTLIINSSTSPNVSFQSYLFSKNVQVELSSNDDDSDDNLTPHSSLTNIENDITTWHDQLAKSLISMHTDMHVIITQFDELLDKNLENDIQHKRIKYELMRIAVLLNPSELPTYYDHESTSPYADMKQINEKFIENNFYKHEKLRSRIFQIIMKLKRGMEKLRFILFSSSYQNQSLEYIHKYRKRISSSLSDIREYLIESDRLKQNFSKENHDEDELTKHRKTVNLAILQMIIRNPLIEKRLEDYKHKLKSSKSEESYVFISSPVVSMQSKLYDRLSSTEQ